MIRDFNILSEVSKMYLAQDVCLGMALNMALNVGASCMCEQTVRLQAVEVIAKNKDVMCLYFGQSLGFALGLPYGQWRGFTNWLSANVIFALVLSAWWGL